MLAQFPMDFAFFEAVIKLLTALLSLVVPYVAFKTLSKKTHFGL